MKCPECKGQDFKTVDSRDSTWNRIKRRKKCACGYSWTTFENCEKKKSKITWHCTYFGCNKKPHSKSNYAKYCDDHFKKWVNFYSKIWRAKKKGAAIPTIPKEFNRKIKNEKLD